MFNKEIKQNRVNKVILISTLLICHKIMKSTAGKILHTNVNCFAGKLQNKPDCK